jgi:hypothetical protein
MAFERRLIMPWKETCVTCQRLLHGLKRRLFGNPVFGPAQAYYLILVIAAPVFHFFITIPTALPRMAIAPAQLSTR